jgi:hypothetical protein
MADISALGTLQPVEPLDLENYADNKDFVAIPKKGRYTLQAPDSFPSTAFGRTKAGALSVAIDPKIVGPTSEGYTIRYTKVSAKPFKRGGVTVSQLGDYLRATGFRGRLTDEQAQADAVESTSNAVYQADLDWRAYNKDTGFSVEGMERFPSDGNGGHLPFYEDPNDFEKDEAGTIVTDAQGEPLHKRLRANVVVARYVPAS